MAENSIIKGILINVKDRKIEEVEFENSLKGVYEKLGCDCVTTVPYPFDEKHEIIVDDESLLKPLQNFGNSLVPSVRCLQIQTNSVRNHLWKNPGKSWRICSGRTCRLTKPRQNWN